MKSYVLLNKKSKYLQQHFDIFLKFHYHEHAKLPWSPIYNRWKSQFDFKNSQITHFLLISFVHKYGYVFLFNAMEFR